MFTPDRLAPMGFNRGHGERRERHDGAERGEQPERQQRPAPEFGQRRRGSPIGPRSQAQRLHRGGGPAETWASERTKQLLRAVARQESPADGADSQDTCILHHFSSACLFHMAGESHACINQPLTRRLLTLIMLSGEHARINQHMSPIVGYATQRGKCRLRRLVGSHASGQEEGRWPSDR